MGQYAISGNRNYFRGNHMYPPQRFLVALTNKGVKLNFKSIAKETSSQH